MYYNTVTCFQAFLSWPTHVTQSRTSIGTGYVTNALIFLKPDSVGQPMLLNHRQICFIVLSDIPHHFQLTQLVYYKFNIIILRFDKV